MACVRQEEGLFLLITPLNLIKIFFKKRGSLIVAFFFVKPKASAFDIQNSKSIASRIQTRINRSF